MKSKITKNLLCGGLILATGAAQAADDKWRAITGADQLRDLIGGLTAEFEYEPGRIATGHYYEDGTAVIDVLNAKFPRTWDIEGDDRVCYTSKVERETNCYYIEQEIAHPENFRAVHVDGTAVYAFGILDGDSKRVASRETPPGDQGGSLSAPSASEVAAELSNPNTALGSMNFYLDYTRMQGDLHGASSADATKLTFQPSMPYPLSKTANFFFRPLIPIIIKQDIPSEDGDGFDQKTLELGDIGYDVAVFNSTSFGLIYGAGLSGIIPTASDKELATDLWTLGPEVILALMKPWGVLGTIFSHQWDIGGNGAGADGEGNVSVTGGQYFYSFNIKNGWVFGANPNFSYNHEADDDKLTFPVGIGASKTAFLGGKPWKFGMQYWYYVESPDLFGPQHQLRFQVTPVVKLPW